MGFIPEISLLKVLAEKLCVSYVNLENIEIYKDAVHRIPENLAKKYTVIAINMQERRLLVATNEPIDFVDVLEDIKMQTGMDTNPVLATKSAIKKVIDSMYRYYK